MTTYRDLNWIGPNGTPVPLARLSFPELVAAHQLLARGQWSAEDAQLLLPAIEAELELRWRRKTLEPRETSATSDSGEERAA